MCSWQWRLFIYIVIGFSVPCLSVLPGPLFWPTKGSVWPKPFQSLDGKQLFVYDPHEINIKGEVEDCPILAEAIVRYRSILQRQSRGNLYDSGSKRRHQHFRDDINPRLTDIFLRLSGKCEIYPYLNMDESYGVKVISNVNDDTGRAMIQAHSVWGILRGLETFSQLSYFNGTIHQLSVLETIIFDKPRFPHRGLMIDTSRHYLSRKTIRLILEAMEYNKYNILHWHVTDDQSFPYQSRLFPRLSQLGAYTVDKVYTDRDIKEIIEYARVRGIRVVPEFDTPGHTQSWGLGKPSLLTKCYTHRHPNGLYGPVDPTYEDNYQFLEALFSEITDIFPDTHFHFGGDEVDFSCWQSNPNISYFMRQQGFGSDYTKLESYYINKVLRIADNLRVSPIVWQEVYLNDRNLSNNTIVHVWTGNMQSILNQVTSTGHNALLSTCWYLDHFVQDLYAGGGDWQKFYVCEPLNFPGTTEMKQRVLGGEACMWGEYVDNTNIIQRIWPRACAAAERLWSSQFDISLAHNRLEEHVCRMRSRGILAQPPNGPSTC